MKNRMRAGFGVVAAALALAAGIAQPAGAVLDEFVPPILTSPCLVANGGQILTGSGDQASFAGSASNDRDRLGQQIYTDRGPAGFTFRSIMMTGLFCIEDGRQADMIGTGIVELPSGERQVVEYRISVRDLGERQTAPPDTYRITLSNGYDSGDQPVEHGNIQILFR